MLQLVGAIQQFYGSIILNLNCILGYKSFLFSAINIGRIEVNPVSDLEQVRVMINSMMEENKDKQMMPSDWCFIDCKYNMLIVTVLQII